MTQDELAIARALHDLKARFDQMSVKVAKVEGLEREVATLRKQLGLSSPNIKGNKKPRVAQVCANRYTCPFYNKTATNLCTDTYSCSDYHPFVRVGFDEDLSILYKL